ncbi:HYR domain-containing protein [Blastococcus sp. DSM 46786]|uniref:OmpL47-type beta-barrel domain-containing protein n=1 Tax=Blastococcus sp. DSM 46786 TaxID=1798227 RepID=UPI0008C262B5|nr:HYR domain-containing protein [Blastococcus sp. DSM 46786]SEK82368.1 HYR domain-containing protein [Blastococcus sp. DSM 46786]
MSASRIRPRPLPLGLVLAGVGTCVLVPTVAGAAENVSSDYRVGCTVAADDSSGSSDDPAGVSYDGTRNDVAASPAAHLVTGSTTARYSMGSFREDCDVNGGYRDQLTVRPGTSGLSEGEEITVQVTIEARGSVGEVWGSDVSFSTLSRYDAEASIRSLDDCTYDGEGTFCTEPLNFSMERERQVYGNAPGSVDLYYDHSHELTADGAEVSYDSVSEEYTLCSSYPHNCGSGQGTPPPAPDETFVATATLVVGSTYLLQGDATALTSAGYYWPNEGGDQLSASAAVDRFLLEVNATAEFADVELAYASAGASADTTAPYVTAEISPAPVGGWNTTAPTVTLTATDGSGVQSITYSATGAKTTEETTAPGDAASLLIDVEGITEITYRAIDVAGNVSEPQTVTVRLDATAPTITGAEDVTVRADEPGGAPVTFEVTATDNLGGPVSVWCVPASGTTFPEGPTTVTCTATDEAGNASSAGFTVTVTPPDPMEELGEAITEIAVPAGIRNALLSKYDEALARFAAGDTAAGCGALGALDNHVSAQAGKKISTADAALLRDLVDGARAENGC